MTDLAHYITGHSASLLRTASVEDHPYAVVGQIHHGPASHIEQCRVCDHNDDMEPHLES